MTSSSTTTLNQWLGQIGLNATTLSYAGIAVAAILLIQYLQYARGKIRLPGPTPLPIFGNLLSLGEVSHFRPAPWETIN